MEQTTQLPGTPSRLGRRPSTPHLGPALTASLIAAAGLIGTLSYAKQTESRYVHALAARDLPIKVTGSAFVREALRHPDLLPLYGSSEVVASDAYHASELFKEYPTGFSVVPVAYFGSSSLILLQKLAALGSDLRGKNIVLSLSPSTFLRPMIEPGTYAVNFSRLHANELIFSADLSYAIKRDAARRMLQYPKTLKAERLLGFAVEQLAQDSQYNRLLYYAILPLGQLSACILRLQDHWETFNAVRDATPVDAVIERRASPIDWPALLKDAEQRARNDSDNNRFGFGNAFWETNRPQLVKQSDGQPPKPQYPALTGLLNWLPRVEHVMEWNDLDLLLRGLQELGARPLLLSAPICGLYCDYWHIPYKAREAYYDKLQLAAQTYDTPLVVFRGHDSDKDFIKDPASHLSSKGWVYYCQTLDCFYHGQALASADDVTAPSQRLNDRSSEAAAVTEDKAVPRVPAYEGSLHYKDSTSFRGWAWDRLRPDSAVNVDIYDGATFLATVVADVLRPDLARAGKGDGRHGFVYRIPGALRDGRPHSIRARISGTALELKCSPDPFTFSSSP